MRRLIAAAAVLGACTTSNDPRPADCGLGELEGEWRWVYTETSGDCGSREDVTVDMASFNGAPSACAVYDESVSSDQCRMEWEAKCPTPGGLGVQRLTFAADQVAEGFVEASMTLQVDHQDGGCRSSYDIEIERL